MDYVAAAIEEHAATSEPATSASGL